MEKGLKKVGKSLGRDSNEETVYNVDLKSIICNYIQGPDRIYPGNFGL